MRRGTVMEKILGATLAWAVIGATFGMAHIGIASSPVDAIAAHDGHIEWVTNPTTGNHYALTPDRMSWTAAEAWAQDRGGHLVTLRSWAEELWVKNAFGRDECFWIGFNVIGREHHADNFVWSSGEPVVYTNWAPGEPNNLGGNEDATIMNDAPHLEDPHGDYWNDVPSTQLHRGVVEIQRECIEATTGTGEVCFTTSHGLIDDLEALPVPPSAPASVTFPHGVFSFKVTELDYHGQTVTVTIELPTAVRAGTKWWKYHDGQWHDYNIPITIDGNTVTITLTDGGIGDIDGAADGTITDPGGPGYPHYVVGWEGSAISKPAVMAPWIALLATMAVVGLLVRRRLRAQM